jgi:hypothetical protein
MHDSNSPSIGFSDPCFIRVSSVAQNRLILIRPIVGGEKRSQIAPLSSPGGGGPPMDPDWAELGSGWLDSPPGRI